MWFQLPPGWLPISRFRQGALTQNKPLPPGLSLLLSASLSSGNWQGKNGLQIPVRVNWGGHNNIEINPEFRGMP